MELAGETFYDRRESGLDIKIQNQQVRPTPDGYLEGTAIKKRTRSRGRGARLPAACHNAAVSGRVRNRCRALTALGRLPLASWRQGLSVTIPSSIAQSKTRWQYSCRYDVGRPGRRLIGVADEICFIPGMISKSQLYENTISGLNLRKCFERQSWAGLPME